MNASGGEKAPQDRRIATEGEGTAIKTLATKAAPSRRPQKDAIPDSLRSRLPQRRRHRHRRSRRRQHLRRLGEFPNTRYLQTAEDAFAYLEKNNTQLCNDSKENIVDDYCAHGPLLNSSALTKNEKYKSAADKRGENLMAASPPKAIGKITGAPTTTPTAPSSTPPTPASPSSASSTYSDIATDAQRTRSRHRRSTPCNSNSPPPAKSPTPSATPPTRPIQRRLRRTAFFFPHDTKPPPGGKVKTPASPHSPPPPPRFQTLHRRQPFHDALQSYAWNQLNWILGENPFDTCMLQSTGRNNIPYMFFTFYEYTNAPRRHHQRHHRRPRQPPRHRLRPRLPRHRKRRRLAAGRTMAPSRRLVSLAASLRD